MTNLGSQPITKLNAATFDDVLRQQDPFGEPGCRFNLGRVTFVSPAGMAQLAAACHRLHRHGRQPVITLTNASGIPLYLVRANFVSVVHGIARFNPPFKPEYLNVFEHRQGASPLLIEVTKLEAGSDLPSLLDSVVDVLRDELRYSNRAAYDVAVAISEAGQNTFDHNVDTCGFFAMQVYGQGNRRFLEIGISDCGDGLAASLRRNLNTPRFDSDHEAIAYATQLGTSEFDDPTRGRGLFYLIDIAYKNGGSVRVRSDTSAMNFRLNPGRERALTVPSMPGVHIALTLPVCLSR